MKGSHSLASRMLTLSAVASMWIFLSGFSLIGEFQTPSAAGSDQARVGVGLSSSYFPCGLYGCASNADQNCVLFASDLWLATRIHETGQLRFRLSLSTSEVLAGEGSHHDFKNGLWGGVSAEYLLSSRGGWFAFIVGMSAMYTYQQGIPLLPYIGGSVAFGDPGNFRPYLNARIGGMAGREALLPFGSFSAGLEIPVGDVDRLMVEATATLTPGGDAAMIFLGGGIGFAF